MFVCRIIVNEVRPVRRRGKSRVGFKGLYVKVDADRYEDQIEDCLSLHLFLGPVGMLNTGSNGTLNCNVHGSFCLAHPFSPYALNLDRRIDLLSELAGCGSLFDAGIISPEAPQTSRPSRSFAVLKVVVIEAVFGVVDGRGTTLRQSLWGKELSLRDDRCDESVSKRA